MACVVDGGPKAWSGSRDKDSHYTFKVTHQVKASVTDGPANVLACPELPQPGDQWEFMDDAHIFAECTQESNATPLSQKDGEPYEYWLVEQTFSTKIDNPFGRGRPPEINISYHKEKEEATEDRFGDPVVNSSHEQLRGPKVEFDANRQTIKIKQWLLDNTENELVDDMMHTVNEKPLWNKPSRTVKLSDCTQEKHWMGRDQLLFYVRTLTFEYRKDGWDRDVLDEGTKCLLGQWNPTTGHWDRRAVGGGVLNPDEFGTYDPALPINPDPSNPAHFDKFPDRKGNHIKGVLNGEGLPFESELSALVFSCPQCPAPGGMKSVWKVTNLGAAYPYAQTIAYTGGCTWFGIQPGTVPFSNFTLEYDSTKKVWRLSRHSVGSGLLVSSWELRASDWNGRTNNTMYLSDPSMPGSYFVTLIPSDDPGVIRVEKYTESDFLQLSIPTEL